MATGFSIVELMVALSVLGILFTVGIPAFGRLLQDIEIRGSAEGLRAALQMARTEAITRNTLIRFSLADASGQPTWAMGCVHASARCPQKISANSARADTKIRWGVAYSNDRISLDVALGAGNRLPSGITFNALGAAPGVATSADASRIDVIHSVNAQARRLVLVIAAAGTVRLCDPSAATDAALRCN
jgi:type IV fimbrial biogenesis protein FimT